MKLSVSLTDEDIELLDTLVSARGLPSRSAGVRAALALARDNGLEAAYEQEWREWSGSAEADLWESTVGDGIEQ